MLLSSFVIFSNLNILLLENEIAAKDNLTEQTQRLKDELNGTILWIIIIKEYMLII